MHVATYRGFIDELNKIAAFIPGVTAARPILKSFHPGAMGFETLAKGVGDTKVMRGAAQAAPGLASKAMGALKSLGGGRVASSSLRGAAAAGITGLAAGGIAEHKLHKNKQDQQGMAIPG